MFVFPRVLFRCSFLAAELQSAWANLSSLSGGEWGWRGSWSSRTPPPTPPLAFVTALLDSQLKLKGFNPAQARNFTANQEEKCSISCKRIQNEVKWAPKRDKLLVFRYTESNRAVERTSRPDWVPTIYVFCLVLYHCHWSGMSGVIQNKEKTI